jgi:hypothetical protein
VKADRFIATDSIKRILAKQGLVMIANDTLPKQLVNLPRWDCANWPPGLHRHLLC